MKGFRGFLLSRDEETNQMRPFFPLIRNRDIVIADIIKPEDVCPHTSMRWELVDQYNSIDNFYYDYVQKFDNDREVDPNAEIISSTFFDGRIQYRFMRNGRVEVDGVIRLDGDAIDFGVNALMFDKIVTLPYACQWESMSASYAVGNVDGLSLVCSMKDDIIRNQDLNKDLEDQKLYPYVLHITEIADNDSYDNRLKKMIPYADPDYSDTEYSEYVKKYIPIRIKLSGRWAAEEVSNAMHIDYTNL